MFDTHRMTAAAFTSAVKSIHTRGNKLQADIHKACVAALLFSLPTAAAAKGEDLPLGDLNATPALQLAQGLSAGMPRNKVINWFATFTNVRITVTGGGKTWAASMLKPGEDGFKQLTAEDVQAAIKCPYWDNDPEVDVPPMDLDKAIAALLKKAKTAAKDGKLSNPEKAARQMLALEKLAPAAAK